jgi:hypothetical protein
VSFNVVIFFRGDETFFENERSLNVPFSRASVEQWLGIIELIGTTKNFGVVPSETAATFITWET